MRIGRRKEEASAFTLVEVLVALMIFAVSAVVLGAAYINVINSYERVRQNNAVEEDLRFIRSMVLQEAEREEVEMGGDLDSLYLGAVTWRAELEPTGMPDLFFVTVEILYEGTEDVPGREEVQQFYLLRPSWSDPADREHLRTETAERLEALQQSREGV